MRCDPECEDQKSRYPVDRTCPENISHYGFHYCFIIHTYLKTVQEALGCVHSRRATYEEIDAL